MNLATLLSTPIGDLLWRKKQDLRRRELNKPPVGATICCAGLRMTIQAGLTDELWRWLVSLGWRELERGQDRLKLRPLPTGHVTRMFDSEPSDRERVLLGAIRQVTRQPVMHTAERASAP
jgi:hypothetical protein